MLVPSVTGIIGANIGWGTEPLLRWAVKMAKLGVDPVRVRDRAGEVGTVAHHMIERCLDQVYDLGKGTPELNETQWAPAVVAAARVAFQAFMEWLTLVKWTPVHSELQLVSDTFKYGGTIDLLATTPEGELMLPDFKTSNAVRESHIIQVAAYQQLVKECTGAWPKVGILWLGKEAPVYQYHSLSDGQLSAGWRAFRAALDLEREREVFVEGTTTGWWRELDR